MVLEYNEKVLEHFMNPRNVGEIKDADGVGEEGSPVCGDMLTVYIKVKDGRISDVKFMSYGCASNIATASMLTEIVKGMSLKEAKKVGWREIVKELGTLPSVKVHCSVLAVDALRKAIEDYEKRQRKG